MTEKEMKECPYCWEEILATAKKCKHCWEFLDWTQKEQAMSTSVIPYSKKLTIHCPNCWYEWKPRKITPWSIWIELILWLCFLIPWLIYSFWRMWAQGTCKCPKCWNTVLGIKQK